MGGVTLSGASLSLQGKSVSASGTLGVKNLSPTLNLAGHLNPDGSIVLTNSISAQTFFGFPIKNASYALSASAGGTAGLRVQCNPDFTIANTGFNGALLDGTLSLDGLADLNVTLGSLTIGGFSFSSVQIGFDHSAGSISPGTFTITSGQLNLPNLPSLNKVFGNGRLNADGTFGNPLSWGGAFSLAGFNTASGTSGTLFLDGSGLKAFGTFSLNGGGANLGNLALNGIVNSDGTFKLESSTSGSFSFLGYNYDFGSKQRLDNAGVHGSGTMKFGDSNGQLSVPISFDLTASSLSLSGSAATTKSGCFGLLETQPCATISGSTALRYETGSIKAKVTATFSTEVPSFTKSISQDIGIDGKVTVDAGKFLDSVKLFDFDLW